MLTIVIDLFHSLPDELSPVDRLHDITGTSEAGINLCLHYRSPYRFYICEDVEHETNVQKWHADCSLAATNHIVLLSDNDEVPDELLRYQGNIRFIINGQGQLADGAIDDEDAIAGFDAKEFMKLVKNFMKRFKIDNNTRQLKELIIHSCQMGKSQQLVKALTAKFSTSTHDLKIILFKEIITFSAGKIISFLNEGDFKTHSLEALTPDVATILHFNRPATKRGPLTLLKNHRDSQQTNSAGHEEEEEEEALTLPSLKRNLQDSSTKRYRIESKNALGSSSH